MWQTSSMYAWRSSLVKRMGLAHGIGPLPAASGPRYNTSAPEAKHVRGLQREAERAQRAGTSSASHDLFPRFLQERCAAMIYAPSLLHIGGTAYFVWAYPPNGGCTAQRHVEVHRRTTSTCLYLLAPGGQETVTPTQLDVRGHACDAHAIQGGPGSSVNVRARNASNSSSVWKRSTWPDVRCSTRPSQHSDASAGWARNWTTKALLLGREGDG